LAYNFHFIKQLLIKLIIMSDTEKTTQPSLGSNDVGSETNDTHLTGVSAGTDTQLHLAARSGNKHKKNVNDDEAVVKNQNGKEEFLEADETDE
jgi:hypothetical protein